MLTTHQDHVCKKCKEKPKTFMKLLKHMAKHYSIESKEEQDVSAANALKVEKNKCKKEKIWRKPKQCPHCSHQHTFRDLETK